MELQTPLQRIGIKLLVCGGRDYQDRNKIYKTLNQIHKETPISLLITGDAKGADHLSYLWALNYTIPTRIFMANWKKYGPRAGPIRNQEMINQAKPDLILAFPGGTGTQNMISLGKKAALPIRIIS